MASPYVAEPTNIQSVFIPPIFSCAKPDFSLCWVLTREKIWVQWKRQYNVGVTILRIFITNFN